MFWLLKTTVSGREVGNVGARLGGVAIVVVVVVVIVDSYSHLLYTAS